MLFLINPLFLISFCCQQPVVWHAAPRTEVIGWDRLESPSVSILLSLHPLSWDMDRLLTFWPLLIPCSLGNGCCTFGFLIFIIVERNFLYNSLYILTERSLKHLCSIRAWIFVSFFLSFSLSLFHVLIIDSRLPGSGPLKDPNKWHPNRDLAYVAFRTEWLRGYWGWDLLRSVSTKTWVKRPESPIISLLYFTICLKLRNFWFCANE